MVKSKILQNTKENPKHFLYKFNNILLKLGQ